MILRIESICIKSKSSYSVVFRDLERDQFVNSVVTVSNVDEIDYTSFEPNVLWEYPLSASDSHLIVKAVLAFHRSQQFA